MKSEKGSPASRADAGRAPEKFICLAAMNDPENKPLPHLLQVAYLDRRFGLSSARASILALLIFGEARP